MKRPAANGAAAQLHTARPALCVGHGQPSGAHAGGREVSLSQLVADCATFTYTPDWLNFALSEDMPIVQGQIFSTGVRNTAPGAIDDARPDRWGERIIRHIDRPARLSILEMLLFAGDDRFGALGVSQSDMELLAASIDRDALRSQRQAFL